MLTGGYKHQDMVTESFSKAALIGLKCKTVEVPFCDTATTSTMAEAL